MCRAWGSLLVIMAVIMLEDGVQLHINWPEPFPANTSMQTAAAFLFTALPHPMHTQSQLTFKVSERAPFSSIPLQVWY